MIRIFRDDEYALMLEFDLEGSKVLEDIFNSAFQKGEGKYKLSYESFLEKDKSVEFLTIKNQGFPGELFFEGNNLEIRLDNDILEFCIERFQNCISSNDFFPAEICDLDYDGHELTLYGVLI